jgi:hypothetical protein
VSITRRTTTLGNDLANGPTTWLHQQAEVFGELQAQRLGLGDVSGPLQGDPEVLDAAKVIADHSS